MTNEQYKENLEKTLNMVDTLQKDSTIKGRKRVKEACDNMLDILKKELNSKLFEKIV